MIGERLKSICEMMTCGSGGNAVVADIGSDHAYLPIWLYINKRIKKAFAADISAASVEKTISNIKKYNISKEIIVPVLSNGLSAFEEGRISPDEADEITHIVIAGMGGNNIADILSASKIARQKVLLLQANTKIEFLRRFLYENNFDITDECLSLDNGRFYVSLRAEYNAEYNKDKNTRDFCEVDIIIGKHIVRKKARGAAHCGEYINKQTARLEKILHDLDKLGEKAFYTETCYGFYEDIRQLIYKINLLNK